MMFLNAVKQIFDIDNLGKRWGARVIFLVLIVAAAAVQFNPYADTDFSAFEGWLDSLYTAASQNGYSMSMFVNIPLTAGNKIYVLTSVASEFLIFTGSLLYTGMFIRERRSGTTAEISGGKKSPDSAADAAISIPRLILRLFVICAVCVILALPLLTISVWLLFVALLAIPFLSVLPAAYLSGDNGFFASFPYTINHVRGYYFAQWRSLCLIFLVYLLSDSLVTLLYSVSVTSYYIAKSAVDVWTALAIARLAGIAYCAMRERPLFRVFKNGPLKPNSRLIINEDDDNDSEDGKEE